MQKNKPDTIRLQTNDIYAYLFSLNQKQCLSDQEQRQIQAMEKLVSDAITRNAGGGSRTDLRAKAGGIEGSEQDS